MPRYMENMEKNTAKKNKRYEGFYLDVAEMKFGCMERYLFMIPV